MLFLIVQSPSPVPPKAANQPTRGENSANRQDSSNKQHPSDTTMRTPSTAQSNQREGQGQSSHDARQTVIVREPAAVSHEDGWDKAYVILTALLVIVGGIGVYLARRSLLAIESQLKRMREQIVEMQKAGQQTERIIDRMEDTAIRELRAYVCVSSAQIGFIRERAPEVQVRIKNYGKTPAYDVRVWIGAALGAHPLTHTLDPPPTGFEMSSSIFAPGAKPHTMVFRHPEIAEEYMSVLGTSELTLYAYGEITYRDAFGKPRFTKYRLMYGGRERAILKDKKGVGMALLKPDTEGNEAT